jgi:hypothetical protein
VTRADDNSRSGASATTTTAPADPEADVEAAYRAYVAMIDRLLESPDPHDPEIPQRTTGAARDDIESFVAQNLADGTIIRKGPAAAESILSIEVSGDEATLRACFVDESGAYDVNTGAVLRPMTIVTSIDTVQLERVDAVWRVSLRRAPGPDERWEGVNRCGQ